MTAVNKTRVFVVLLAHDPSMRDPASADAIDFGMWTEQKASHGIGSCYRVIDTAEPENPFYSPEDGPRWRFEHTPVVDCRELPVIIGRIMVGKVPYTVGTRRLCQILRDLPRENVVNSASWTKCALRELQCHECVDQFGLTNFMTYALSCGRYWHHHNLQNGRRLWKINYTNRPMN